MSDPNGLFGGGGGGNFPKIDDFEGKLVILKPSKVEQVPKPQRFGGKPGEMQDRATADVIVFDENGEVEDTVDDMYFSQVGIVNPCKRALKPGKPPYVLGRVSKVPSQQTKQMDPPLDTVEKLYAGIAQWRQDIAKGKKAVEPKFAWGLIDYTEADLVAATKYITAQSPIASGAE